MVYISALGIHICGLVFLADLFYLELGAPFNNQDSGTAAGAALLPSKIYYWP